MRSFINQQIVHEEPEEQANQSLSQDRKKDNSIIQSQQKKNNSSQQSEIMRSQQQQMNPIQQSQVNPNFQYKIDSKKAIGLNFDEKENMLEKILKELNFPLEFPNYSSREYWNERYQLELNESFEWLQPYSTLKPYIHKILAGKFDTAICLYVGCGNSRLGEEMFADDIKNIWCLDFSEVLINNFQERYKNQSVQYIITDVTEKIEFPPGSVDLVIDKGLIDAILCGEGFFEHVKKYLTETWKVLKVRGTLLLLSQGHPDTRVLYLKNKLYPFGLNIQEIKKIQIPSFATLDDLQYHYLYICTKQQL